KCNCNHDTFHMHAAHLCRPSSFRPRPWEEGGFSFWLNVKRKPRACRGFQELTMKGILESRCPRRSDTIPRHKSGKARIATGCLRHAPGALYSYQRCVELPPLPD